MKKHPSYIIFSSCVALILCMTNPLFAQTDTEEEASTPESENTAASIDDTDVQDTSEVASEATETPKINNADETTSDAQAARLAELEAKLKAQNEELTARMDELEQREEEAALLSLPSGFEPSFSVFGFFDLTFNAIFPEKDGFFDGMIYDSPSFMIQNLNLYFKSELTETLSVLSELQFTFAPLGDVESLGMEGISEYERTDTTAINQFTSEDIRLGGVRIERVHLTWQPRDEFGIIAGRFLTPYGIWNVEHGSPVIVAIRPPFSQTSHYLPLSQTGLQAFGTFHFSGKSRLKYALTFSNGRGPMDEVYDLNANKAGGIRLRHLLESKLLRFALGGYGYANTYTDTERVIVSVSPFDGNNVEVEKYTEWVGALDALVEIKGFRAQAEFLRRLVQYDIRPYILPGDDKLSTVSGYPADYVGTSFYVLLAYTLPLKLPVSFTPYTLGEYVELNDNVESTMGINIVQGLNVKPSPYVTLKAEYYRVFFPNWNSDDDDGQHFQGVAAQMAVSF